LEGGRVGVKRNFESVGAEGRGIWNFVDEASDVTWEAGSEDSSELKRTRTLTLKEGDRDGSTCASRREDQSEIFSSVEFLVLSWSRHGSEARCLSKS